MHGCDPQVRLTFEWDITAKGLLGLQLEAMERVLAQRLEILCMLDPVSAPAALAWAVHKQSARSHKVRLADLRVACQDTGDVLYRFLYRSLVILLLGSLCVNRFALALISLYTCYRSLGRFC